jgi:hypothetical protein
MINRKAELKWCVRSKNGGRGILLIFQPIDNRGSNSVASDVGVDRQRSKNQSTTKINERFSIGRSTALSTMTIVTRPASGMPTLLVNYAITPS